MVRNTGASNGNDGDNFNPESFMNEILDSNESSDEDFEDDFEDEFEDDFEDDDEEDEEDDEDDDFDDEPVNELNEFEDLNLENTNEVVVLDNTEDEEIIAHTVNESDEPVPEAMDSDEPVPEAMDSDEPVPEAMDSDEPVPEAMDSDEPVPEAMDSDEPVPEAMDSDEPVPEAMDSDEPAVAHNIERENTAAAFFETLDDNARSSLINAFAYTWRNMINDADNEEFQELIEELNIRRSIAMEHLEIYSDGENAAKLKLAQEDIETIESEISRTTAKSKAPEEMTLGMVRFSLDLGSLIINESKLEGRENLLISGIQFKGQTFDNRIDVTSTKQRNVTSSTERRTRTVERKTKPCTEILVYEQGNNNAVHCTFNGREYGVRPLTNATIMLAEQEGSAFEKHGCSWDSSKEEYIMPRREDCKNLPFTAGGDGEGKAQVHFLASLACSTGRRVTGIHHGEIEFDMIPDGTGNLQIVDVNGVEYRTGKIRTEAKTGRLNLID